MNTQPPLLLDRLPEKLAGALTLPALVDIWAEKPDPALAALSGVAAFVAPVTPPPGASHLWRFSTPLLDEANRLMPVGQAKAQGACAAHVVKGRPLNLTALNEALTATRALNLPIIVPTEEPSFASAAATESDAALILGLPTVPAWAEEQMVETWITLARATCARLHLHPVTTQGGIRRLAAAKREGLNVTASTTLFHLTMNSVAIENYDARARTSPPLRAEEDRAATLAAVLDGTIDAIASGHVPMALEAKLAPFTDATPGAPSLPVWAALLLDLADGSAVSFKQLWAASSLKPAAILDLNDISAITLDTEAPWRWADAVRDSREAAQAASSPFGKRPLMGRLVPSSAASLPASPSDKAA